MNKKVAEEKGKDDKEILFVDSIKESTFEAIFHNSFKSRFDFPILTISSPRHCIWSVLGPFANHAQRF